MTETSASGRIEYQIQIGEFAAQEGWEDVLARLRERVPNLSAFIETQRQQHSEFLIPRTFDLDQAMRLREVLAACGLTVSVVPAPSYSAAALDGSGTSPVVERPRDLITEWSNFLAFGPLPQALVGTDALVLGLGFRVLAGLLSVPAWQAIFPAFASSSLGDVLVVEAVAFVSDISILWLGLRLFAPRCPRSATSIEAAVAPTFLLDAVPVVGFFAGSVWRLGLRAQAILSAQPAEEHSGKMIYAVLIPMLAIGAAVTLVVSAVILLVRSSLALPVSVLPL